MFGFLKDEGLLVSTEKNPPFEDHTHSRSTFQQIEEALKGSLNVLSQELPERGGLGLSEGVYI
jgi:hypothetical protein